MKKGLIIILVIVVILAVVGISTYNGLIASQTGVDEQQANIMAQLQRRNDLIPNLVKTVNNYTTHETEVFAAVTQARENMMAARTMPEMAQADNEMTAALSSLIAVAEAYPELKSDTVYIGLMDELSGTENRIAVARTDYNAAVKDYNLSIRSFPGSIFANMFGFEKAEFFEATQQALTTVPSVS